MPSDPEYDSHNTKREELLSGLLTSVQQCQVRFGGRTELAIETDDRVKTLCTCLEDALSHGLKARSPYRGLAAIKQVKDIVTSGLNLHLTLPGSEAEAPALWWYIRELLTRHEYERFMLLKSIITDHGRGRAWLRSLLNEHSLERYMHILVCDEALLQRWYEPWALLRDPERAAMLPNLAAGLDSILFAINIDNAELNSGGTSEPSLKPELEPCTKNEPEPQIASTVETPHPGNPAVLRKRDLRRKKKKVPSQLISFDDDLSRPDRPDVNTPLYHSAPTTCLNSPAYTTGSATPYADRLEKLGQLRELQRAKEVLKSSDEAANDLDISVRDKKMGNVEEKSSRENAFEGPLDVDLEKSVHNSSSSNKNIKCDESINDSYNQLFENILPKNSVIKPQRPNSLYDQETGSCKSSQSNLSADSFPSSDGDLGAGVFTPVDGSSIRGLIPVSPRGIVSLEGIHSDDDTSVHSYSQEVDEAAAAVADVVRYERKTGVMSPDSITSSMPSSSSGDTTLTVDELKSAVLEISRARDAAEGRRLEVATALSQEMETSSMLRAEITHQQTLHNETLDKFNTKVNTLTRENELLKHQLKKYVGAVQLLRREGSTGDGSPQQTSTRTVPDYRDYHHEAAAYEMKLIQVAEMHGELMEFNERLQKLLRMREAQVRRLREELVDLRGPLPDEQDNEDDLDESSITSDLDALSISTAPRTLINCWIPTAFLTGTSSDTHHVYQVYVRIRDDEWNVYRRFAQFYELHKQLKKKDPIVKTFEFPQKKTFGYKEDGVVEDRRVCLQQYVRLVVNLVIAKHSQLATAPDKATFTSLLPFFADMHQPRDTNNGNRSRPSRRGVLSRFAGNRQDNQPGLSDTPQYNGL